LNSFTTAHTFLLLVAGALPALATQSMEVAPQDESAAVVAAAVEAIRPRLGEGSVALDVSALCTARLAQWSCPSPVRQSLARLRMVPSSRELAHVCPSGADSCRLIGVRHLVVPGRPRIRGGSAQLSLEILSAAAADSPPMTQRHLVHLTRERGVWSAVRVERGR
jgi:hypothetical protein